MGLTHGVDKQATDSWGASRKVVDKEKLQEVLDDHGQWLLRKRGQRADLSNASLHRISLDGADLRYAILRGADLSGADLRYAKLCIADLSSANLCYTNLIGADLSGATGLPTADEWVMQQEQDNHGVIVYKTFGAQYRPSNSWTVEPGSVLTETVNPARTTPCSSGINVGSYSYIAMMCEGQIWQCRIAWADLADLVVPYGTDGKARCARLTLIEKVTD